MLSTGIDALDHRLGGLVAGRYYLVTGVPGAGKTSVALHFLGAGLEAGDRCAILTQDDPEDLIAQADFLGYDFRTAAEEERLIVLQYRLDFAHNFTRSIDPDDVARELLALLGEPLPTRLVIDSILPFVDGGNVMHGPAHALARVLDRVPGTLYLTLPGDISENYYLPIYNRVTAGAAGILHLQVSDGFVCGGPSGNPPGRLHAGGAINFPIPPFARGLTHKLLRHFGPAWRIWSGCAAARPRPPNR